jgi:hypothetical protein
MQRAAIGVRAHSGWAAVVAIAGGPDSVQVIDRRRIVVTDSKITGAKQPYHFVEEFALKDAEAFLTKCSAVAERLAVKTLRQMITEMRNRGYQAKEAAILLASGRPLPALPQILASHALIHTAEGEFFRDVFRQACRSLEIRVADIRERDLDACAADCFGRSADRARNGIAAAGKAMGPPWTQDQKLAALAGLVVLSRTA